MYVPTTRPMTPTMTRNTFLMDIKTKCVLLMQYQYVHDSSRAGIARPSADRHKAPKSEINNSRLGIATASKTEKK